jgi:hypothetical protein
LKKVRQIPSMECMRERVVMIANEEMVLVFQGPLSPLAKLLNPTLWTGSWNSGPIKVITPYLLRVLMLYDLRPSLGFPML